MVEAPRVRTTSTGVHWSDVPTKSTPPGLHFSLNIYLETFQILNAILEAR